MRKRASESFRILTNADWVKKRRTPCRTFSSSFDLDPFFCGTDLLTLLEAQRIDESPFCSLGEENIVQCYDA